MRRSCQSRAKRHRDAYAVRSLVRHAEAVGASNGALKAAAAKGSAFAFTGPGLALMGLRRGRRRSIKAIG